MVPKDTSFPHYIWPTYKVLISKYTIQQKKLWLNFMDSFDIIIVYLDMSTLYEGQI